MLVSSLDWMKDLLAGQVGGATDAAQRMRRDRRWALYHTFDTRRNTTRGRETDSRSRFEAASV
jgi:hypothetical protein